MNYPIAQSTPSELAEVLTLLKEVNLPTEGVREHFSSFLLARHDERVGGCVGIEIYGSYGLLRSLAVTPELQGQGLGAKLTEAIIKYAQANTVQTIVLLTTTAEHFFAKQFGFEKVERQEFDTIFQSSPEWGLTQCASAICLRRDLQE